MSGGIFYLDEERDRESSPSPSPRPSPRASPTLAPSDPRASPLSLPAASPFSNSTPASIPVPPVLQVPTPVSGSTSALLASQPQSIARKHAGPFAATPSFPSPLAQAITVPTHSDTSSSGSHSDSDEDAAAEREGEERIVRTTLNTPTLPADGTIPRPRTASPHTSRSGSPASTAKSLSRPPSPRGPQIMTPGSLLMKSKRSTSGSLLSGSLPGPATLPKDGPTRLSPTHPGARRFSNATASPSTSDHRRGSSGSNASLGIPPSGFGTTSPLAFGSPELEPLQDESPTRSLSLRASSVSPVRGGKEPNVMGLGWTSGFDSPGSVKDKGKGKDTPSGSGSLSPRVSQRDRDRTAVSAGMASPPRQRRPSEFLNPSGDARKMPIIGGPRMSMSNAHIPSLSTSASMISPLNPLPSPWAAETDSSPFSPPKSQTSDMSSSASTSSIGGAIRLNRVPTSVRMAADLIKNSTPAQPSPPSGPSSASTASVPTPNPSPAGSLPNSSSMPPPPPRELGAFASMPAPSGGRSGSSNFADLGKGRPTLSVPGTPRQSTPAGPSPTNTVSGVDLANLARKPSTSTLAPPSAFKAPLPPQPRTRPSLPAEPVPSSAQSDTFPSKKTHRYRTSLHEASFKRPSLLSESPPLMPAAVAPARETASSSKAFPLGLGLNVPPGTARLATSLNAGASSGSITPGGPMQPRQRSTTGKALQMDLAGIGALGDAASHASMIMQSRQAKLQRWRPNSAGKQAGQEKLLPPAFNRSTTTGAPAMLAGPRMDRQNEWGVHDGQSITAASSPGEDLPPFPSAMHELGRVGSLPMDSMVPPTIDRTSTNASLKSNAGPSRFSASPAMATGMERQASAGGSIGGIEWVDWYDCYKGYKEAKIRAEAQSAQRARQLDESPLDESQAEFSSAAHSPIETSRPRDVDLGSIYDNSSAIALTPSTSRDELGGVDNRFRKRSMSIRSAMSSLDPTRSPTQKRNSIFERPRQTSGSSVRSNAESISSGNGSKKKKNLVNKMEGWWNAVKSNFIPEGQLAHRPIRPSNLGVYPSQRIPSAPTSRRGSNHSPITAPQAALLPPEPIRRDSSQSLRQVTSHAELRPRQYDSVRLQAAASIVPSTSADIARLSRESTQEPMALVMNRAPSMVPEEPSRFPSRVPSSLETRRRGQGGANLRLDLESNVLVQPDSHRTSSNGSAGQSAHVPPHLRSTGSSSRTSSYGQTMYGPGLTPGVPKWDQTPSPIYALSGDSRGDKEDRPVAPGAEITVASVRRHIKHRLNAAKDTCDNTLKKAIDNMTRFADEQKAAQIRQEMDEQPMDYFDALSDSPLVDAEESEVEGGDMFDDGFRSRHASTSRPPSRRPSISRPLNLVGASPTKRLAMLPSSPSRVRRRPSAVPRTFPGQQRLPRGASMSIDRAASAASSRSTSRSRSPMPTSTRGAAPPTEEAEENRLFLATLQDLIVLATEVLDSSVNTLITKAGTCAEYVQKLQRIGVNWDEHEDWPGRVWYVDILMAVANLSRVLDWWQAEKGFWNFGEEDDNEPIMFVMKPQGVKEDSRFDKEFGAALTEHRHSPASATVQVLEPPATGVLLEVPSPTSTLGSGGNTAKAVTVDTPKNATAAEDLKFLAEHAKSVNIVMELGLQEEEIQYVNDAIMEVIGRDPEDVLNSPITDLLAPADMSVFAEATQKLLEDDNNTVQLRFRFEVHELEKESHPPLQPGPVYIELEGVGMLMRENNEPSHTMWVLKPVTATQLHLDSAEEAAFPSVGVLSTEAILCRICEREIVTWFFEKHNETCDAVHRLEAEITGCNECLHELQQTVSGLQADIEDVTSGSSPQYSGVLFFSLPESITSGHENTAPTEPQGVEVRKVVLESIQDVLAVVTLAQQIDVPSVQEDEADLPFNVQRYLSRESEEKLQKISRWQKPSTSDRALALLFSHAEEQLRKKQKAIARMQSTLRYSEKTRHEWEDKVNRLVVDGDGEDSSPSESGSDAADGPGSPTEATSPAPTPANEPESSPPSQRKIAPQARLPITQGHPQRPSTSHGEQSYTSIPPTPVHIAAPSSIMATPNSAPLPTEAVFQSLTAVISPPAMKPRKAESKPVSPLLAPMDALSIGGGGTHSRRASSSRAFRDAPLSPRIPSAAIPTRTAQPSIKDFEIIKPISRGAFGSVYLAKKVATGDYFAIKALKKSDMIAKNQITNVKAERTILMNQASSPYVAKLFFSFQSKEYLYLVMEYLNGGDCSTLVKTLGGLPEEWARNYTAEVTLGLEYLHARNIVHRDIKPDNLLIDSRGHLKLTDFGLSRIGLLNRQVGGPRPAYLRGTNLRGSTKRRPTNNRNDSGSSAESPTMSPELLPAPPMLNRGHSYFNGIPDIDTADESSGSESAGLIPRHMRTMSMAHKSSGPGTPPRFVGTPDYLAPESILGIGTDDKAVDWWALGVVLYEFIYGIPPFHADTPEKVFDNVVSRRIEWHEEDIEVSPAARDLMDRLMCSDPTRRLGARGADEVKQHAFFAGIDWATIATSEASFVPEIADPESTDYFDPRGATQTFHDDDGVQVLKQPEPLNLAGAQASPISTAASREMNEVIDDIESQDDFGAFNFKNLPVLKQANDDVIRKLRSDSMAPIGQTLEGGQSMARRPRSLSIKLRDRARRKPSDSTQASSHLGGPPSPSTSTSSAASTPSRASIPPSTPGAMPIPSHHFRRPSELNALERVKSSQDSDVLRRASAPSRVRAGSGSSISERSTQVGMWRKKRQVSLNSEANSAAGGVHSILPPLESPESHSSFASGQSSDRTLDVLIAEDNPISQKILETLLTRMGCRCICVEDGPQALAATMGSIRFDVIICDIHMPVVSGEQVARMIRSTNNHNQNTPIIAATSYDENQEVTEEGTLFSAVLGKPVTKPDLIKCLAKLGFILSSSAGSNSTTDTASVVAQA